MKTIIIEKNQYMYKGKIYEDSEIENLINKCGKRIKIIILSENILIKICENIDINTNKDIEKYIVNNLNIDDDTLVDYVIDKKLKNLYIYSIKRGRKVSNILIKADNMMVEPVQYILLKIIKKKFRYKKNYRALVKISNYIYFICVKSGKLISSKTIEEREGTLHKVLKEDLTGETLLVDINLKKTIIENVLEKQVLKNINFIDLKEKVDYEISKV